MLVSSLVRKTLGVKDHRIVSVKGDLSGLVIQLDRVRRRRLPCSACGQRGKGYDTLKQRTWRHVHLWGIPTQIVYRPRRVDCKQCGVIKVERIPWATHSRLTPMRNFAWMLRRHETDILNYIDLPMDNGAVEAMNNNAKAISHRAHGFRSENWFSTVMLHGMGELPMPEFTHRFS